jgi:L-seryl-tRNA(Ser) seleniumtransferase
MSDSHLSSKVTRSGFPRLKLGRRSFLSSLGAAGLGLLGSGKLNAVGAKGAAHNGEAKMAKKVDGDPVVVIKTGLGSTGDVYTELGLTPMINTGGIISVVGGSVMKPEVMELMRQGDEHFVFIDELYLAAGKFITNLCKSPAGYTAMVTNGAAASILVGFAGMMTEDYEPRLEAIPDLSYFPKTEVIILATHRNAFDHQIRQLGAKLVVVNSREELIAAINPRTVGVYWSHSAGDRGPVMAEEMIKICKDHNIYGYCDASADVPPKSRLWELPAMGWDMIGFSGGKDISGPQSTGVLIGKEKLINWSILNTAPQEDRVGRPCKVGREQIVAQLKALEIFVNRDEDAENKMFDARAQMITDALSKFGVTSSRTYNTQSQGAQLPHYTYQWDSSKVNLTGAQLTEQLIATRPVAIGYVFPADYDPLDGSHGKRGRPDPNWPVGLDPARYGRTQGAGQGQAGGRGGRGQANPNSYGISFAQIKEGETEIIAARMVEIFSAAKKA